MFSRLRHRLLPLAALAAIAAAASITLAGCGGDDSGAAKDAAILNAITIIDDAGLHEIDESINDKKEIPADARTTVQRLQAVTNITGWPGDLQAQADALARVFAEFAAALEGDHPDMAKAGEASKKAHDGAHDFSHEVWEYLYEKGGVETGAAGGH